MRFQPFDLERLQSIWENRIAWNISESGVHPLRLDELADREEDRDALFEQHLAYTQTNGTLELREAIAALYNQLFRRGMPSKYSAENVAVSGGGRTALTRVAAALGHINLGHFLPDYTAYEELLDVFRAFSPIPILLEGERGYAFSAADLRKEVLGRGLSAVLASNPSNPTGKVIGGDDLAAWVAVGRELDCALILDEFY